MASDGMIPLPAGVIACEPGGKQVRALPDNDPTLEMIESFRDFLAVAGPPHKKDEPRRPHPDIIGYWEALDRFDPTAAAYLDAAVDRYLAWGSLT